MTERVDKVVNVTFTLQEKKFLNAITTKQDTSLRKYIRGLVIQEMEKPENEYLLEFIEK